MTTEGGTVSSNTARADKPRGSLTHARLEGVQVVLSLAAANDLAHLGHQHVHGGHRLRPKVQRQGSRGWNSESERADS